MQELKGFMILYIETSGRNGVHRNAFVAPESEFDKLWDRAQAYVGEHHEADGMSTQPQKYKRGEVHGIWRNNSFGGRRVELERLPILVEA